jgi:hypothetical protein
LAYIYNLPKEIFLKMSGHLRQHSFTGNTDHNFEGLESGQILYLKCGSDNYWLYIEKKDLYYCYKDSITDCYNKNKFDFEKYDNNLYKKSLENFIKLFAS